MEFAPLLDDRGERVACWSAADGKKRASVGQYVVKDSAGNFYVVSPGVFEAQYTETL